MTDQNEDLDPLRTFDLDADTWENVRKIVDDEGKDAWRDFAPQIVAAIELGFLDDHLQMLGMYLRQQWMHLVDSNNLAPQYVAAMSGSMKNTLNQSDLSDGLWANMDDALRDPDVVRNLIPEDGIRPIRRYVPGETLRGQFKARGYVFDKDAFAGRYFVSTVPDQPRCLCRIDTVGRTNFSVTVVASVTGKKVGRNFSFDMERQFKIYNLPAGS